jgi:hypothetical protein
MLKPVHLFFMALMVVPASMNAQQMGFVFNSGVSQPSLGFTSNNGESLSYTAVANPYCSIGINVRNDDIVGCLLISSTSIDANAESTDITHSVGYRSRDIEMQLGKSLENQWIRFVMAGAGLSKLQSEYSVINGINQVANGLTHFAQNGMFGSIQFGLKGYETANLRVNPYVNYRLGLSNLEQEGSGDVTKVNAINLGLRIEL